jgi:hypothetical protein
VDVQVVQQARQRLLDYGNPDVVDRREKIADALDQIAQFVFSDER